jgi:hypothetical protein
MVKKNNFAVFYVISVTIHGQRNNKRFNMNRKVKYVLNAARPEAAAFVRVNPRHSRTDIE